MRQGKGALNQMARLVFAAHDPGGALMIAAASGSILSAGHNISYIGAGTAIEVWRRAGYEVLEAGPDGRICGIIKESCDALITGTGFGDFERNCWLWARSVSCPAMAVIDAWTGFPRRFEGTDGFLAPDIIGVIDNEMAVQLSQLIDPKTQVVEIGQPHLRVQTQKLMEERLGKRSSKEKPTWVFFSEPILQDFGPIQRGFDQFKIFEGLVAVLKSGFSLNLVVKPHPRECREDWFTHCQKTHISNAVSMHCSDAPAEKLLLEADVVIGMTTMVLLEAYLLRIPIVSVQIGRKGIFNPLIEEITEPVVGTTDLKDIFRALIGTCHDNSQMSPRFQALLDGGDQRFVKAIESLT